MLSRQAFESDTWVFWRAIEGNGDVQPEKNDLGKWVKCLPSLRAVICPIEEETILCSRERDENQ